MEGNTSTYQRDDLGYDPWCEVRFCPRCGTTTHFVVIQPDLKGIGINMRLFEQDELDGIEMRYYDSRSFSRGGEEAKLTGTGKIGDGCAF